MTFLNNGSVLDIFGFIGICGICIVLFVFLYKIIYGLFCYNNSIKIFNANQENSLGSNINDNDNDNEDNDVIVSISNITPFNTVSCVNILEDSIIDNDKNLPIATIV
jgi:hypothetical protein